MGFYSRVFLVFLMKESKKRRRKQPGKLMAKSCSQPVNLPGARPLMNPLGEDRCVTTLITAAKETTAGHILIKNI